MNRYTDKELLAIAKKEIERYKKMLDKITGFCCQLENQAYDIGLEDTIKPITNKILNLIKGE